GIAVDGALPPAPSAPSGVLPAAQPVGDEQREVRGVALGDPCALRLRGCPDPVPPLLELGDAQPAEPEVVLGIEALGHLLPVAPHLVCAAERADLRDVPPHPPGAEQP